ncbi:MAG: zinc-binding dehydrogenase [Anaerolineae bacterium]
MSADKMKAVLFLGPKSLSFEEVNVPAIGDDEMLVKVGSALTCGTDLKAYLRGHPLFVPPMPFGHEFAGVVARVGKGVERFREGMRVVAANSAPCNICFYCKRGQHNLCQNLQENMNWGAYAEYIKVPGPIVQQNTHVIPDHLSFPEAAVLEPLACVVAGNQAADIQWGDSVAILGGTGPIGLLHLQLALHRGAGQVIAIGRKSHRLEVAGQLGATHVINATEEDVVARVKDLTGGRGADVVIESVGIPEAWQTAVDMVRKGGTVVFFGGCPSGSRVEFDTHRLHYHELTLKGVFHHTPRTVERALNLLAAGVVDAKPLISGQLPLDQVARGLEMMADGQCIKMAIVP